MAGYFFPSRARACFGAREGDDGGTDPVVNASAPAPDNLAHLESSKWFAAQVQPHEEALRAYLRGRFPTLPDIDDLVQETYARLLRTHATGDVVEVRPYLFAVARNAALDLLRRNQVVAFESLGDMAGLSVMEEKPDAAEATARSQEMALVHEAIDLLPPRCQEVLRLRRFDGLPVKAIAARLGLSPKTIEAHLCAALLHCRRFLLSRGMSRDRLASARGPAAP